MSAGSGWFVPFDYVVSLVGVFIGALGLLWFGVVVRVFVNNERRLVALETYADPRNEDIRNKLLMSQFRELLAQMELRLGNNLEVKRASIESTIRSKVNEVVETLKENGGGGR
jgi:hypothetical protein